GVPGILHRPKAAFKPSRSHAKSIHIHLADDDRAGLFQFVDASRVFIRNAIFEILKRGRRFDASDVIEILDADWNTLQGASPLVLTYFFLSDFRGLQGALASHRNESIESSLKCADSL